MLYCFSTVYKLSLKQSSMRQNQCSSSCNVLHVAGMKTAESPTLIQMMQDMVCWNLHCKCNVSLGQAIVMYYHYHHRYRPRFFMNQTEISGKFHFNSAQLCNKTNYFSQIVVFHWKIEHKINIRNNDVMSNTVTWITWAKTSAQQQCLVARDLKIMKTWTI